jgi:membrane protein YqaA with SNARE-associated domain
MAFFKRLSEKILQSTNSPYIFWWFGFMAFLSGSIVPLPVDPLFVLLALQNPKKIPILVFVGSVGVVLGGVAMYFFGYTFYHMFGKDLIETYKLQNQFIFLKQQLDIWGGWAIVLKAFTPFPYKIVAVICGIVHLNLFIFILSSFLGRFLRFSIEGLILAFFGQKILEAFKKHFIISLSILLGFLCFMLMLMLFF